MKRVALVVLAALVFSVYAPRVQAQPFADVPTDIFAFDAVAELAAKGIIEGYPDGTFKGDRAMTRYEMAMVVARILARIEAIKIPPPPAAPPVGVAPADLAAVQRLVNEFRAELAAQGVRVTAVEEELAALRARLSNVKFTGDLQFRYNIIPTSTANGPSAADVPLAYMRNRLQFEGKAAPNVTAVARIITGNTSTSSRFPFSTFGGNTALAEVNFDKSYIDFDPLFGLSWRLGRQYYTLAPVGLQGYGLLFDPAEGQVAGAFPGGTFGGGFGTVDGLLAKGAFGGFKFEAAAWRMGVIDCGAAVAGVCAGGFPTIEPAFNTRSIGDFWTGAVSTTPVPGWTIRLSGLVELWNGNCGFVIAGTAACPGFPNTNDTGYSVDASGDIFPGVTLGAAYATWTGHSAATTTVSSNAWEVWSNINLSQVAGLSMWSPTLGLSYKSYGTAGAPCSTANTVCPVFSAAITDNAEAQQWNFQGWAVELSLKLTPDLTGSVWYETGNTVNSNAGSLGAFNNTAAPAGTSTTEYFAALDYTIATRTVVHFYWFYQTYGSGFGDNTNFYRITLEYSY